MLGAIIGNNASDPRIPTKGSPHIMPISDAGNAWLLSAAISGSQNKKRLKNVKKVLDIVTCMFEAHYRNVLRANQQGNGTIYI